MAAFTVLENWSGSFLSLKPPWTATKEYTVEQISVGLPDEAGALAAVPFKLNDGHPYNTKRMKCQGPVVKKRNGPFFWTIVCPFAIPDGGRYPAETADPLDLPAKIWWEPCEMTAPADHDLANRPICNSAADLQTAPRRISYKRLIIEKNLPFYDYMLSAKFENTVNAADVALSGTVTAMTEHIRCAMIGPAIGSYAPDVEFMPMRFIFDIMGNLVIGKYPWQTRMIDSGNNGWYGSDPNKKTGKFTNGREAVDFPVKLDGTGKPLLNPYGDPISVGDQNGTSSNAPTTPPHAVSVYKREYYKFDGTFQSALDANTASVVNYFLACKVVDFTPLLNLL